MALAQAADRAVHLTDRVKLDLVELIEVHALKPGDRLPPTDQLCRQFAVSRTVVREAIASLKAEGRLRSLRGSGVYVAEPGALASGSPMFMAAPQEIGDVMEFMEFRIAVEVEAAGLAAERRTETNLLRMAQALTQFTRQMAGAGLSADADRAFHRAIADASNNRRFRLFADEMGERLIPRRALGASFVDDASRLAFLNAIQGQHEAIYEAISGRNADAARLTMRRWSLAQELADTGGS
jgi:DNA-binding FadR family transcriptional regulator